MSVQNSSPATKADIEDLRQHLFGTWKAVGHVLAAIHGQEKAAQIVATAADSARETEHMAVFQLVEVALEYIGKGAASTPVRH